MFGHTPTINRILHQLDQELVGLAFWSGELLSITLPIREIHLRGLPEIHGNYFYWAKPQDGSYRLGLGQCYKTDATGPQRLPHLQHHLEGISRHWLSLDPEESGVEPIAFAGFAFDPEEPMEGAWQPFPNSALYFPELLIQQSRNLCTLTFTTELDPGSRKQEILHRWATRLGELFSSLRTPVEPGSQRSGLKRVFDTPGRDDWISMVRDLRQQIRQGALQKAVPARHIGVRAERRLSPARLMAVLDYLYPSSMLVAIRQNGCTLAAATPERLTQRSGSRIQCDAIAGTQKRAAAEQLDRELATALISDPKARHEHALVVDSIREGLAPLCTNLEIPEKPYILRLRNLHHLKTSINAELNRQAGILDVCARIHPTAAVNGMPGLEALQWLRSNEHFRRGWYTGGAGWIGQSGDGEIAVLLRCALLTGDTAELYAGAGVTAESDPVAEWQETELKLGAMLEALENA
jgi:isochorismate synthase